MDFVKIPTKSKELNFQFIPEAELRGNQLRDFIFAGNSLFTILNEETGNYFTFKVKKHKEEDVWFVSVLSNHNYIHIGTCFSNKKFNIKRGDVLFITDQKISTFSWFMGTFLDNQNKYTMVKVYHHGRCGACAKTLTTPESIKSGIGPICGGKLRRR